MPVVIAAIVATLVLAPPNDPNPEKKWDLVSSIWALIGLVGAVLTIKELAHVPQNWAVIVGAAISSGIGCVLFVLRQRKLAEPIGIVYHFPSREALLASLQQHLADQWETALIEAAGAPVDRLTDAQRAAAYARVAATSAAARSSCWSSRPPQTPSSRPPGPGSWRPGRHRHRRVCR